MMSDNTTRHLIALSMIKGIGPVLAKNIIAALGSPEAIFQEKKQNLIKIAGIGEILSNAIISQPDLLQRADMEIEYLHKHNFQALAYTDKKYPYRLKECSDAPIILYSNGAIDFNKGRFISFVGTRNITDYGRNICESIIGELTQAIPDIVIVSGLAYGVDITAHKAVIRQNMPTIGVVAHGLDRISPSVHTSIAAKMAETGAIVTEYPIKTEPDKPNFVQRNRIIAGLCDASVIIESAAKGGSLLTAEAANLYNRDVFAIPGRIGDPKSAGCNNLIRQNKAALIESATDIINAMGWQRTSAQQHIQSTLFNELTDDEQLVISLLRQHDTLQINQLTIKLKLPVEKLFPLLIELEFKGYIRCLPGSMYKVV